VHVPKKIRKKLDAKSKKGILVGYESESVLYRVYLPQRRKVVTSRDLIICKNEFAYGNKVPVFISQRNDGEILSDIMPVSDTAPAAIHAPLPSPTPAVTSTSAVTPTLVPASSPEVEDARPIYDQIVVLPLPAPMPAPATGDQRSNNPVVSNYGLRQGWH